MQQDHTAAPAEEHLSRSRQTGEQGKTLQSTTEILWGKFTSKDVQVEHPSALAMAHQAEVNILIGRLKTI